MTSKDNTILSIGEYFSKKQFVIPNYQRGYKWGVPKPKCAVSVLIDDLIATNWENEYFVQGVTVYEENQAVYLIDGQQRTTTFFLLLYVLVLEREDLLLDDNTSKLKYAVRADSDLYLQNLLKGEETEEHKPNDPQDIFYFKKALKTIKNRLVTFNPEELSQFTKFILDNVKLFYIVIKKEQSTKTFLMLNGNKAKMKEEELIKSAILSRASRNDKNEADKEKKGNETLTTKDWEINALRNKYAREWDKWLYWWEKPSVSDYFGTNKSTMGLLLEYFYYSELKKKKGETKNNENFNFENFNKAFLSGNQLAKISPNQSAKITFKGIRDLQKTFEDWYNNPIIYNYIGLILTLTNKREVILYLLNLDKSVSKELFLEKIKDYSKWVLVGASHAQIIEKVKEGEETRHEKAQQVLGILSEPFIYWDNENKEFQDGRKEFAFKQLLRLNVECDSQLNRKFDFSIWQNRSLEHIFPKSKANCSGDGCIDFSNEQDISVHCIGNLVLLYGRDNSAFGAKDFNDKKQMFFSYPSDEKQLKEHKKILKSIQLLHSVSVFSVQNWDIDAIRTNQTNFINKFKATYNL